MGILSASRDLKDRLVLVTGAASGIGRRLARDLYWNEKSRLLLVDVDAAELAALKNEMEPAGEGDRVETFVCDISSAEAVAALARSLGDRRLDVLVNDAGIARLGAFETADFADFERVIAVNLVGSARVTKALLPCLLRSPEAFIVNVASLAGLVGAPGMSAYVASKFGLVGFSDALRLELKGRVGVGVVCPSFVRTNIARDAGGRADSFLAFAGADPRKASAAIVRTIKRRRRLTLVGAGARALYYSRRFLPGAGDALVSLGYRLLRATGVLVE